MNEHDIKPENIESILVTGGIFCQTLFQCATPQALQRPQSSIDAKVSMPFIVGAAAAHSKVVLDTFTSQGRNDPLTLEMAQKVTFSHDSRFSKSGYEGDLTEIRTKDGKRYSKEVEFAYGHPQNPMSMPDLIAKFKDLRFAFSKTYA